MPDGTDFEVVAENCMDVSGARRKLLELCVIEVYREGEPSSLVELPEAVIERLGKRMEELDPLAELPLAITCDRCEHQWSALFDIVLFLWQDVEQAAQRLLDEVHVLAEAYGWREEEILAVSAARRKYYIDKIPSER